jgi:hypothetical protein
MLVVEMGHIVDMSRKDEAVKLVNQDEVGSLLIS